ncbi:MAG: hypothetical protein CL489_05240 [Acidobacteria bacterium]|nr:hypothetical protein [Acidobacteriota bacterium]
MDDRFVILTEYFRSTHTGRQKEITKSIEVNCRIPQTKRVVLFMDSETRFPDELKRVLSTENFNKIEVVRHPVCSQCGHSRQRSTYADFFSYVNEHLNGELCVLCNNDISFDDSLDQIKTAKDFNLEDHFICLTRWDVMRDNSLKFKQPVRIRKNSQDAWIFKPPLPAKMLEKGGFYMGRPGCDGMVSYLATISGLKVFNPSETVKAKHLHLSKYRTYDRKHRMGGDDIYICTFPTDQIQFDPTKLMYKFGHPRRWVFGQEAIDQTIEFEEDNQKHWDYALGKCLRLK